MNSTLIYLEIWTANFCPKFENVINRFLKRVYSI
jgi:hypothetical protein